MRMRCAYDTQATTDFCAVYQYAGDIRGEKAKKRIVPTSSGYTPKMND